MIDKGESMKNAITHKRHIYTWYQNIFNYNYTSVRAGAGAGVGGRRLWLTGSICQYAFQLTAIFLHGKPGLKAVLTNKNLSMGIY